MCPTGGVLDSCPEDRKNGGGGGPLKGWSTKKKPVKRSFDPTEVGSVETIGSQREEEVGLGGGEGEGEGAGERGNNGAQTTTT